MINFRTSTSRKYQKDPKSIKSHIVDETLALNITQLNECKSLKQNVLLPIVEVPCKNYVFATNIACNVFASFWTGEKSWVSSLKRGLVTRRKMNAADVINTGKDCDPAPPRGRAWRWLDLKLYLSLPLTNKASSTSSTRLKQ